MPDINQGMREDAPINWVPAIIFSSTFLIAITAVPLYGFLVGYDWVEIVTCIVMVAFCGFSITGGYHRLWSHRAYDANPLVRAFFAFWGACALQNTILIWCSGHRRHHRHVDDVDKDPYSIKRGFWFAHIGWMLRNYKSSDVDLANTQDLQRDKIVMFQHKYYVPLVVASNIGVPVALGILNGDVLGMLLLAGVLRLVISHHVTFFINSLCHTWGKQPYTSTNTAKDNFFLALVTYGEGYHNFHHYFQTDYRNGVRWWQFDPTKWMIASLSWIGMTSNLKRVPSFKIQEALVHMQFEKAHKQLNLSRLPTPNVEALRQTLESEYQQFSKTLADWKELHGQWVQQKRQEFEEKKQELQEKWQQATVRTRFLEMEYNLKMQRKRLQMFSLNFATAHSS
ncbi:fatty acid desaturase [Ketobacter nezhaii]|uniref:fatty acid desaturase n=1 Tax=Ketobacter sp. MCCC 1A13808 TaxID=2602738 RepID=UPI001E4A91E8|nr:fatty acid desaturase [Ketobacter sp. MCCC 1A13808]